jgi:hypothetical protein
MIFIIYKLSSKKNIMECILCGKETNNPKFCSRSCAAKHTNKIYPKRKTKKTCTICGDPVKSYKHSHCEKHHNEYVENKIETLKNLPLKSFWNKKSLEYLPKSSKNVYIRNFARSHFKYLTEKPCYNCGYNKHVELCHIKPISKFDEDSKLCEINCEDNLIQLCRNCHWEFDNGLLKINK